MSDHSLSGGVVLQIAGLVKQLYDYGRAVSHAQSDIVRVCGELSALKGVLLDLEDRSAGQTGPAVDERLRTTQNLVHRTQNLVSNLHSDFITKAQKHQ